MPQIMGTLWCVLGIILNAKFLVLKHKVQKQAGKFSIERLIEHITRQPRACLTFSELRERKYANVYSAK